MQRQNNVRHTTIINIQSLVIQRPCYNCRCLSYVWCLHSTASPPLLPTHPTSWPLCLSVGHERLPLRPLFVANVHHQSSQYWITFDWSVTLELADCQRHRTETLESVDCQRHRTETLELGDCQRYRTGTLESVDCQRDRTETLELADCQMLRWSWRTVSCDAEVGRLSDVTLEDCQM